MVEKISAKVLLSHIKQPDDWFGLKYNMNLYRGCQHQCIYCDSRSLCYGIEDFAHIQVKENAIDLLRKELAGKRVKGTIGTGSMNEGCIQNQCR
jgi:DNA repair photolyase